MSFSGYFDYNATTPVCVEALDAFMEAATAFANPSSSYALSSTSKHLMREARENVAALIGARADEVSFTSGGTEANNWAIKGAFFQRLGGRRERPHLIVSAIEHASVLETCCWICCRLISRMRPCSCTVRICCS